MYDWQKDSIEKQLAYVQLKKLKREEQEAQKPALKIPWNGTAVDFAEWIYEAWSKGPKIKTETITEAFTLASEHFCQRNGKPFKPRSLQVSLKSRQDFK